MKQRPHKITENGNYPFYSYHSKEYIEYQGCGNVSAEENKRKYSIENKSKKEVVKYKIDGGLLTDVDGKKCDFGFYTEDDVLFLVELKGSDYCQAIEQIINTIEKLVKAPKIKITKINARVVLSRVRPPELRSSGEQKLRRILDSYGKDNDNLKKKDIQMTEFL
ncbi:MAG: hypothetical protein J6U21_02575 [Bacteroidales bacterium]|nr:hypothetical protein [Bacteroidales bacterium]